MRPFAFPLFHLSAFSLLVLLAIPAGARAQALYGKDAPKDKAAKSWQEEKKKLPKFDPPKTADGHPDMQGYWGGLGSGDDIEEHAYIDITTPPQESFLIDPPDGKIPYQPWALAERNKYRAGLGRGWPGESGVKLHIDPQTFCFTTIPRANYRGGFQIVQAADRFVFLLDWGHFYRSIPTDGRPHAVASSVKMLMGNSVGHWEGDTLVVDVTGLDGKLWLDSAGNFFSNTAHMVERWTMVGQNVIDYSVTIEDPTVYTRPWTINLPMRRNRNSDEIWEHACHEGEQDYDTVKENGYTPWWGVIPPKK
jgi:hypothetical protein